MQEFVEIVIRDWEVIPGSNAFGHRHTTGNG